MSDVTVRAGAWLAFAVHVLVGAAVARHKASTSLVVALNFIVAGSVLVYWGRKWFGYLFRGITWYAMDQLIPLYALVVCLICVLTLSGRAQAVGLHWTILALHTVVLLAAALFFTFFRMNRLF